MGMLDPPQICKTLFRHSIDLHSNFSTSANNTQRNNLCTTRSEHTVPLDLPSGHPLLCFKMSMPPETIQVKRIKRDRDEAELEDGDKFEGPDYLRQYFPTVIPCSS